MEWRAARCSDIEENCGIKSFKLPNDVKERMVELGLSNKEEN